jgi:DNA-binding HxlR family transcriptional regulator
VSRGYRMMCPIARALDRLGDRWVLLMLRDLHAGRMRFGELREGLPGLASNLLAARLDKLQADGLVSREDGLYALTERGRATDRVLWELAQLGMSFPPDPDPRRPGHLRLVAVTLQGALRRVAPKKLRLVVELVLDGESFTIAAAAGDLTVRYGAPENPQVTAHSSYEPMMAALGGEMPLETFRARHMRVEGDPRATERFQQLMERAMTEGFSTSAEARSRP